MPFGGRASERYELNGTGQVSRERTYGSIVRDRTYGSIGSYSSMDPEAHFNFICDDDLDNQRTPWGFTNSAYIITEEQMNTHQKEQMNTQQHLEHSTHNTTQTEHLTNHINTKEHNEHPRNPNMNTQKQREHSQNSNMNTKGKTEHQQNPNINTNEQTENLRNPNINKQEQTEHSRNPNMNIKIEHVQNHNTDSHEQNHNFLEQTETKDKEPRKIDNRSMNNNTEERTIEKDPRVKVKTPRKLYKTSLNVDPLNTEQRTENRTMISEQMNTPEFSLSTESNQGSQKCSPESLLNPEFHQIFPHHLGDSNPKIPDDFQRRIESHPKGLESQARIPEHQFPGDSNPKIPDDFQRRIESHLKGLESQARIRDYQFPGDSKPKITYDFQRRIESHPKVLEYGIDTQTKNSGLNFPADLPDDFQSRIESHPKSVESHEKISVDVPDAAHRRLKSLSLETHNVNPEQKFPVSHPYVQDVPDAIHKRRDYQRRSLIFHGHFPGETETDSPYKPLETHIKIPEHNVQGDSTQTLKHHQKILEQGLETHGTIPGQIFPGDIQSDSQHHLPRSTKYLEPHIKITKQNIPDPHVPDSTQRLKHQKSLESHGKIPGALEPHTRFSGTMKPAVSFPELTTDITAPLRASRSHSITGHDLDSHLFVFGSQMLNADSSILTPYYKKKITRRSWADRLYSQSDTESSCAESLDPDCESSLRLNWNAWADLSGEVLKELWMDAKTLVHNTVQHGGGDSDSWGSNKSGSRHPPREHPSNLKEDATTFFRDGRRRIDYVLVYEDSDTGSRKGREDKDKSRDKSQTRTKSASERRADKHEAWRHRFMQSLMRAGLHMEEETEHTGKKVLYFIKVSAPWPVLCHYAEELNMRAPLQAHNNPSTNWSENILERLRIPNIMAEEVPNKPLDFFTCAFKKSKIDRFLGSDNPDQYFTTTQRARIVHEILSTATFGKRKKGEIGIGRLVEEGVYSASFPLHDGEFELPQNWREGSGCDLNPRQVLYEYWARWGKWYKYQPLDHIREYFGEKIGIYFAWLGLYTGWLLPAAIVGLLVFIYGVFTINNNIPANEICNGRGLFTMCPLCNETLGCVFWDLNDICVNTRISYLFDHPGTVFYATFVSFWAVSFLEYWKRKSASLAHHWDCLDFQEEEERPRPEFAAKAPCQERNPITGVREPSFPKTLRTKRIMAGVGLIFIMMSLVIIFIVAVIIYRVLVSIPLFRNDTLRSQAQAISSLSGAVVNFIIIMCMGRVYEKLAHRLTTWEMHRTQSDFEDNLTFKVFIFQFVNFYSSIFYIAFFKGRFVGYPGHYHHILGFRNEDCSAGGCLIELAQQLAVIMIGKQVVNNAQEILVPKVKAWWHKKQVKLTHKARTRWESDYQLIDNEGLFQEYLEMVLQFGFITIFVAAFPLAPLFALLNNWVEIRLDAQKFVCETRRAVSERAQNIGIWFTILDFMAHLAVISNAFLIAFTSEFLPRLLYKYEYDWSLAGYVNFTLAMAPDGTLSQPCRYRGFRDAEGNHTLFYWRLLAVRLAFVIVFEHVVFGVCRLIDVVVPDVPQSLEIKMKRERYLAKQALADSDTIMKVAQGNDDDDDAGNDVTIGMPDADTPSQIFLPPPPSSTTIVHRRASPPSSTTKESQPSRPSEDTHSSLRKQRKSENETKSIPDSEVFSFQKATEVSKTSVPSDTEAFSPSMPSKDSLTFSSYDFENLRDSPPLSPSRFFPSSTSAAYTKPSSTTTKTEPSTVFNDHSKAFDAPSTAFNDPPTAFNDSKVFKDSSTFNERHDPTTSSTSHARRKQRHHLQQQQQQLQEQKLQEQQQPLQKSPFGDTKIPPPVPSRKRDSKRGSQKQRSGGGPQEQQKAPSHGSIGSPVT